MSTHIKIKIRENYEKELYSVIQDFIPLAAMAHINNSKSCSHIYTSNVSKNFVLNHSIASIVIIVTTIFSQTKIALELISAITSQFSEYVSSLLKEVTLITKKDAFPKNESLLSKGFSKIQKVINDYLKSSGINKDWKAASKISVKDAYEWYTNSRRV